MTERLQPYRMLFVAATLVLPLQFALIYGRIGEPYPALMMPGFNGSLMDANGVISFHTVDVVVDLAGPPKTDNLSLAVLLAPLPAAMVMPTASLAFHSREPLRAIVPPRSGLKDWLVDTLLPLRQVRFRRAVTGNAPTAETIEWLRRRLHYLYPHRMARSIAFRWYRDSYSIRDGHLVRLSHEPVDTYRIRLAGH